MLHSYISGLHYIICVWSKRTQTRHNMTQQYKNCVYFCCVLRTDIPIVSNPRCAARPGPSACWDRNEGIDITPTWTKYLCRGSRKTTPSTWDQAPYQTGSSGDRYVINAWPWTEVSVTWRKYNCAQLSRRGNPSNTRSCATHITSGQYAQVCNAPMWGQRYRGAPCWSSYRPIRRTHKRRT